MNVSDSLILDQKKPSVPASSSLVKFTPSNGTNFSYNASSTISVPIRVGGSHKFLDWKHSYLKMTVKNNSKSSTGAGVAVNFDQNLASLIKRFSVSAGGSLLSTTDRYNIITGALIKLTGTDDYIRMLSSLSGESSADNSEDLTTGDATNKILAGASTTLILPVISGFLNSGKMIPLSYLADGFLTVDLELESGRRGLISSSDTDILDYEISNVEIIGKIVTLEDPKIQQQMLMLHKTNKVAIHTSEYMTHISTLTNSSTQEISIPDRSVSTKNVYMLLCPQGESNINSSLQSGRYGLKSFQLNIGGILYPPNKINVSSSNSCEAMASFKICQNSLMSTNVSTSVSYATFMRDVVGDKKGAFIIALNLENFTSDSSVSESGLNTSKMAVNMSMSLEFEADLTIQLQAITFINRDVIYRFLSDNTLKVMA